MPFYGSANNVVPRARAAEWLEQALKLDWQVAAPAAFAATLIARMSGDRERDLDPQRHKKSPRGSVQRGASPDMDPNG